MKRYYVHFFYRHFSSFSFFFSSSKKKGYEIKRERAVMMTKCTEFRFIINKISIFLEKKRQKTSYLIAL